MTERNDFLYFSGGATKDDFFGFASTPAKGAPTGVHEVGYLLDIALTWKPIDLLTFYAYYGHVFGGDVIVVRGARGELRLPRVDGRVLSVASGARAGRRADNLTR